MNGHRTVCSAGMILCLFLCAPVVLGECTPTPGLFYTNEVLRANNTFTAGAYVLTKNASGLQVTKAGTVIYSYSTTAGCASRYYFYGTSSNYLLIQDAKSDGITATYVVTLVNLGHAPSPAEFELLHQEWFVSGTPQFNFQPSPGNGEAVFIFVGVGTGQLSQAQNPKIYCSDNGTEMCSASAFHATTQVIAEATATTVRIKDGGTIVNECDLPSPQISVSTTPIAFGSVVEGTSATRTLDISNSAGTAPLSITLSTVPASSIFSATPTSSVIAAGGHQLVTLTCAPPTGIPAGTKAATLSLAHNDPPPPTSPIAIDLSSVVVAAAPHLTLSPTSLAFGNVVAGQSRAKSFTIQNSGTAALTFSLAPTNSMFGAAPTSGSVAAGASRQIAVTFTPPLGTSPGDVLGSTLDITHNDPNESSPLHYALTATVVAPTRLIDASPSALAFGKVGVNYNLTQVVTIQNGGNSPLTVNNMTTSDARFHVEQSFPITVPSGGGTVPVEVTFSPLALGPLNAQLQFQSDATNLAPTLTLSGEGIVAPLVDAFLVLDRTGSMAENAGGSMTKIERLHSAANLFLDLARANLGDNLGIVQFQYPGSDYVVHLSSITSASKATMKSAVDALTPAGWTSIGAGLELAFAEMTDPSISTHEHRVLVLLTDGMENRPPFVDPLNGSPVTTLPTSPNIHIYTVGFGLPENMNADLLSRLAFNSVGSTRGYFYLTYDNWYSLHKYFISIFGDTFDEYIAADPTFHLGTGQRADMPVTVIDADKAATFAACWTHPEARVRVVLTSPAHTVITPENAAAHGIVFRSGATYAFYQVSFLEPVQGDKRLVRAPPRPEPNPRGVWTLNISAEAVPAGIATEIASASVVMQSDLSFRPSVSQGVYSTGVPMLLSAELLEQGRPVQADEVTVTVTRPNQGLGNLLSTLEVTDADYKLMSDYPRDATASAKAKKVMVLQKRLPGPLIDYGTDVVRLYDDGSHGDGSAGDGTWSNAYANTRIEGSYTLYYRASVRSRSGEATTREKCLSTVVAPRVVDWTTTKIRLTHVSPDAVGALAYRLTVVPKDALGNYFGPGYANAIRVLVEKARLVGSIADNNAGQYSCVFLLPRATKAGDVKLTLEMFKSRTTIQMSELIRGKKD